MNVSQVFLGHLYDMSAFVQQDEIEVRAKPGRDLTILQICDEALEKDEISMQMTARLRGLVQFYAGSVAGRIAKGGMQPISKM